MCLCLPLARTPGLHWESEPGVQVRSDHSPLMSPARKWVDQRGDHIYQDPDQLWHFISQTGPNTAKTWFISPVFLCHLDYSLLFKFKAHSPVFTINSSYLRSRDLLSGSLSRPLTTSSVCWHYDRWAGRPTCNIGSHDLIYWSVAGGPRPGARVSLSSARAGWIRIPFSLTSLQRLTCVTFLSWQLASVTLQVWQCVTHDWL